MAEAVAPATAWPRTEAPARRPLKGSVPVALSPFNVHRPAFTVHAQSATRTTGSTI